MLKNADFKEFRWNRKAEYIQPQPFDGFRRKTKKAVVVRSGATCVACGLKRSVTNKCFCNED